MIAYERVVDAFRAEGLVVIEKSAGRAQAQAPGHSPADRSVSITDIGEQVLVHSHSDQTEDVLETLGLTVKDLFDTEKGVDYQYSDGRIKHRSPDKKFFQSGNTTGDALYHVEKIGDTGPIFVTEGEKDVHALEALGMTAVSCAGGAGQAHKSDLTPLYGRQVWIVRDMDDAGEKHANQLLDLLGEYASEVKVLKPKVGKDAADHVAAGYDVEDFDVDTDFAKRQMLLSVYNQLKAAKDLPIEEALASLYNTLDAARPQSDEKAFYDWDEAVDEWWTWLGDPNGPDVIPLPWPDINDSLNGGAHRKRSILFAGRPGEGKSISLTMIAMFAARMGFKVAIYSLEMDRLEIVSRMMAAGADAEYGQITKKEVDEKNMIKLATLGDEVTGAKVFVSDRAGLKIEHVIAECRQLNLQHDIDLFLFDYVQLLRSVESDKREEALDKIGKGIRFIAKTCNAACISAAQLNREGTKEDRPPTIADLRGSGSLEQDADTVVLIHHEKFEGMPTGDVQFILGKNRTGHTRQHTMQWKPYRAQIA